MMKRVKPGDVVRLKLPWSEACMHLRIADHVRDVRVLADGAQILNDDGTRFSFPVTHGEAGIYSDAQGLYIQEDRGPTHRKPVKELVSGDITANGPIVSVSEPDALGRVTLTLESGRTMWRHIDDDLGLTDED
jgi:hypothetical protein